MWVFGQFFEVWNCTWIFLKDNMYNIISLQSEQTAQYWNLSMLYSNLQQQLAFQHIKIGNCTQKHVTQINDQTRLSNYNWFTTKHVMPKIIFTARPHCSQLAMQTTVITKSILPVRLIPVFCPDEWRWIVWFSASGRTIIPVSWEVKFIRIFARHHPQQGVKVKPPPVTSENLTNNGQMA